MLDMPPQMSLLSRIHLQTDGQQWVLSEPQRIFSAERSQIMNLPQPLNGGANIQEEFRRRFVCAIVCVCHRLRVRVRGRVCVCACAVDGEAADRAIANTTMQWEF